MLYKHFSQLDQYSRMTTNGMALLMLFLVLVLSMVSPGVESERDEQESSLHYRINSRKAEFLKAKCRLDLMRGKKIFLDLKLTIKEDEQIVRNCLGENFVLPNTKDVLARYYSSTGRKLAQMLAEVSVVQSNEQKTNNTTVVIAIAVTACVMLVASTMLFFCWRRFGRGRNNKRRLHSSSLNDCSSRTQINGEDSKLNQNKISTSYVASHSLKDSKVEIPLETFSASTAYSAGEIGLLQPEKAACFPFPTPPPNPPVAPRSLGPPPSPPSAKPSCIGPCQPPPVLSHIKTGPLAPPPCAPIPPPRPLPKTSPHALPPCAPLTPTQQPPCAPTPPPRPPPKTSPDAPPPCAPIPPPRQPPCAPTPPPRPPPKTGSPAAPPCAPNPPPRPPPCAPTTPSRSPPKTGSHAPPPCAPTPPSRPPPLRLKSAPAAPSHPLTLGPPKAKLKPFFWDKILANPDHSMVWHQVKSGSFKINEEMIEKLFGHTPAGKNQNDACKKSSSEDLSIQHTRIIDPKKSQNLSILLKALNLTTDEICDALAEGTELPPELIQTLLKMAPTAEEETKLRQYTGKVSLLSPAERFLKALVDIPFAFKRLESMLFMCTLDEEMSTLKKSFIVLEEACTELRKSRLFLKLLEAVLKTGNRLNDGTFRGRAEAFKLDTLLKLSDVKGTDGETTLLHFIVRQIVHSEGIRLIQASKVSQADNDTQDSGQNDVHSIGLRIVSGLGSELEHVKKAAALDIDSLSENVAKLGNALVKIKDFWNADMKNIAEETGLHQSLKSFVDNAEVNVIWLVEEERRIMCLVKNASDYFHRNAGKEGLRLFVIVRDFVIIVDQICKKFENVTKK